MFKEKLYMQRYLLITKWTVIFFQKNMDWRSLAHSGEKIYKEEKHSKDDQHNKKVSVFFKKTSLKARNATFHITSSK